MDDETFDPEKHKMQTCVVCGRWMALSKESQRVYCCEDCSRLYKTCTVCGRTYTPTSDQDTPDDGICSDDCRLDRPDYYPLFKELDE